MFRNFKEIYFGFLPIFLIPTLTFGILNGIRFGLERKEPFTSFCETIGYTSIGMITGITYPISFPLLAVYVLTKEKEKQDE